MYHLWKYVYGARKCKSMLRPCVSVLNLGIRVCSCINLSESLVKSAFNITHSRSEIEWSSLLKCLATGSPLLLSPTLYSCLAHIDNRPTLDKCSSRQESPLHQPLPVKKCMKSKCQICNIIDTRPSLKIPRTNITVLPLQSVGRSNFDKGRHNLTTLIHKTDIY